MSGDWWALGCLLFEMETGVPPFFNVDSKRLITRILCKLLLQSHSLDTEPDYS